MNELEIEKKYLLPKNYKVDLSLPSVDIEQYYTSESGSNHEFRCRAVKDNETGVMWYEMTEKLDATPVRIERSVAIHRMTFDDFKAFKKGMPITKRRSRDGGMEIDIYTGRLQGLVTVEIEFDSIEQYTAFEPVHPILKDAVDVTNVFALKNRTLADLVNYDEVMERLKAEIHVHNHIKNDNC